MKRNPTAGLAAAVVCALSGATYAQPGEAAAPAAPPPRATDRTPSIEEARKDFDAVKSLRNFGGDPKAEGMRVPLPKMQGRAGPAPAEPPPAAAKSEEGKRNPNWLVDAMEERATARDRRRTDSFSTQSDRKEDDDRNRGDPDAEEQREPKPRSVSRNPFAPFLGDWMTPQDFALLKPGLEQTSPGAGFRSNLPTSRAGDGFVAATQDYGLDALAGAPTPAPSLIRSGTPQENPYLELVERPGPAPTFVSPSPVTRSSLPPSASPAITPPPRAPASTSRSTLPEFVRPNDDAKYFKPLKRF